MEIRFLEPEEFTAFNAIPEPDRATLPKWAIAVGAFDGERLIGRLVAISLPFIECAWIAPECRNGLIGARMESLLRERLKMLGSSLALAIAVDEQMESYLGRLGYSKLGTIWKKEI